MGFLILWIEVKFLGLKKKVGMKCHPSYFYIPYLFFGHFVGVIRHNPIYNDPRGSALHLDGL